MKGAVTKVFTDQGYAFVRGTDGVSRFVHASWVSHGMFDTLVKGTPVEFTPAMGDRGPQALDLKVLLGETA